MPIGIREIDEDRVPLASPVTILPLPEGPFASGPLTVRILPPEHPPVPCFAYRFDAEGKAVVFGSDLLIHEAMLEAALPALMGRIGNADERLMRHWLRSHSFAHEAARIARKAGVKALALNHLIPSDDPAHGPAEWRAAFVGEWQGAFHPGHDGLRIGI